MSLSELMSKMGLADLTGAAMVIFIAVFVAVTIRTIAYRRATVTHNSQLPFDDGTEAKETSP